MTDRELIDALTRLGIRPEDPRAVLLLPLAQVAWADGAIQEPERLRILEVARGYGLAGGAGPVERWLAVRPSDEELALGRRVVAALALRHRGPTADWGPAVLDRLEQQCEDVARAAGGLFGLVFATSADERAALAEIQQALRSAVAQNDEDLPDPDGGGFADV